MALTPAFTISQTALNPALILATDTSTGSDVAITQRRIFFQTAYGTYLVVDGTLTDYETWSYADASKTFDVLDKDHSLSITLQWLDAGGNVLYTLTQVYALTEYNKQFLYHLIQLQALTPDAIADKGYFASMATYWMNIIGAIKAIEIGADVAAAQNCLDRATDMKTNQTAYF